MSSPSSGGTSSTVTLGPAPRRDTETGCIEVGDGTRSAAAAANVIPEALAADAEGDTTPMPVTTEGPPE
jgi:hypothetical protein